MSASTVLPHVSVVTVLALASAIVSIASADECVEQNVRYELIPLSDKAGTALSINERGDLVGRFSLPDGTTSSFVWSCPRGMTRFRGEGNASMINNRRQIVGYLADQTFIWDRARGTQLLGEGFPTSLNDWGDVTFEGADHFLWTAATGTAALLDLTGATFAEALVNNRRQVGGYVYDPVEGPTPQFGFVNWSASDGLRIIVEPAGPDSDDPVPNLMLSGYNERGDILGTWFFGSHIVAFIVMSDGTTKDILPLTGGVNVRSSGFNNQRQVIGYSEGYPGYPFLWDPTNLFRDLNVMIYGHVPAANEPAITAVNAINEWGWIATSARTAASTASSPALLVPVPADEPYYSNLARLRGPRLCKALTSLQVRAATRASSCASNGADASNSTAE